MKFILNKDKLEIENKKVPNSGSINYYEAEVEFDESWNGLSIEARFVKDKEEEGRSVAVINNKIYIDQELFGRYCIGFVGYTIENNVKTYQVSSELFPISFKKGAGEIEVSNSEEVPTPSEWEIYVAQIQSITSEINGLADSLSSAVTDVEERLENGDFDGKDGKDGKDGADGHDGIDGISPILTETETQNGYDISITDVNGTRTISLLNGKDGTNGKDGQPGADGKDGVNGKDGKDGQPGADGHTPVKGVDYFTQADAEEFLSDYYKKNATYSKTEIDNMIGNIETLLSEV